MKRTVSLPECPESWHKESDYGAFVFYLKYLLRCCGHKSNQIISICEKSVRFCEKSRKEKYLYETGKEMWSWQDTSSSNTSMGGITAWAPVHLPADLASWVRTMELSGLIWMFYSVRKARLKKYNTQRPLARACPSSWLHSLPTSATLRQTQLSSFLWTLPGPPS